MKVINNFPRMFNSLDFDVIRDSIAMVEIENILKSCTRDNSLGSYKWFVQFFI